METLPTIESTTPLNPEINPRKYEHSCQVEENPGGQVPPEGRLNSHVYVFLLI
jgi:hypothetical protein